jgi:hypothetical protein
LKRCFIKYIFFSASFTPVECKYLSLPSQCLKRTFSDFFVYKSCQRMTQILRVYKSCQRMTQSLRVYKSCQKMTQILRIKYLKRCFIKYIFFSASFTPVECKYLSLPSQYLKRTFSDFFFNINHKTDMNITNKLFCWYMLYFSGFVLLLAWSCNWDIRCEKTRE